MDHSPPSTPRRHQRAADVRPLSPVEADPWPVLVLGQTWAMSARIRLIAEPQPLHAPVRGARHPNAAAYAELQPGGRPVSARHGHG